MAPVRLVLCNSGIALAASFSARLSCSLISCLEVFKRLRLVRFAFSGSEEVFMLGKFLFPHPRIKRDMIVVDFGRFTLAGCHVVISDYMPDTIR